VNIIITGINGFLGRNLIPNLSQHNIIGIDLNDGQIGNIPVYSSTNLDNLPFNPDIIVFCHAAVVSGTDTLENKILYEVNVGVTEKITLKFKDATYIFISTASIYEKSLNTIIHENSPIKPKSFYAISKLWAEEVILKNPKSLVIRLSSLYGIGMKENTLIPNYVNQALNNHKIEVWGDGSRYQNYIHVNDISQLVKIIIDNNIYDAYIHLGVNNFEYSNLEIAKIIKSYIDCEIVFKNSDNTLSHRYDNSLTNKKLNWEPKTTIIDGISNYIEWKKQK
jgi:nucleoside-diphosphate-sugar epimerase